MELEAMEMNVLRSSQSSSYPQVFLYQSFGDYSECTNYNQCHRQLHVPYFLVVLQGLGTYLPFRLLLFLLSGLSKQQSPLLGRSSFLSTIIRSVRLAEIKWFVFMLKSQTSLVVSFYETVFRLNIYKLYVWWNLNDSIYCICLCDGQFRINHHVIYIYYFLASYLYLLEIFGTYSVFCATIWRDSGSLLRSLFLNHVQVFLCGIWHVSRLKYPSSCFSYHLCFIVIVALLDFVVVSGCCN